MGRDFLEAAPAQAVFEEAGALVGDDFLDTIFHGEEAQLNDTRLAQPALVTVEVAIARYVEEERQILPVGVAGHSLGEISALVVAEAWSFEEALRFTLERARLMSEDVPEGGMAAVMGLDAEAIERALPKGAQIANYNGPQQTIISGTTEALAQAETALKEAGAKRVLPLKVSGPFHSELMRPAAEKLRAWLEEITFQPPRCRFISSVTGEEVSDTNYLRQILADQLFSPVRWTQVMQLIGPVGALEVGPGTVLKGLAKRIEGAPDVQSAGTLEEAAGL
jgi:[acyl-carrier-protein] S-malonyltransferase